VKNEFTDGAITSVATPPDRPPLLPAGSTFSERVLFLLSGELATIRRLDHGSGAVLHVVARALLEAMPKDQRRELVREMAKGLLEQSVKRNGPE
jgi:hypothetical protein